MNSGRRGRPIECYTPKSGPPLPGLRRCSDGRWRVRLPSGRRIRFTEPDETQAIHRAKALLDGERPTIDLPLKLESSRGKTLMERAMNAARPRKLKLRLRLGEPSTATASMDASGFWEAVRNELLTRPNYVAAMTGIPALANLANLPMPQPSVKLSHLIQVYQDNNPSTDKSKAEAIKPLKRLIEDASAKTLADLTTEKLLAFRQAIENDPRLTSAATRRAYFGRVKNVIAFGLKVGLDSLQIRAALDRCKVLWTAEPMPNVKPQPISCAHFHALLNAAGNGPWRAWLLVGLNLCLHIEEVCALRWADLDLEAGTHVAIREKTRRRRIPRAAVLWPETLAALMTISRQGPYVFTSRHGTRYNKNTRVNDFRDLRKMAELPDTVTFDTLRDGAYTAACHGTSDDRKAKVLAGHSAGMSDNYVLRNPRFVEAACQAVYEIYGPF